MIVRVQGWAEGATPPANIDTAASYTDFDVLKCEAKEVFRRYRTIEGSSTFDGTNLSWKRKYLSVVIDFGPRIMSDTTSRSNLMTMLANTYFRIKDTRHALLGNANTVVFVVAGDIVPERDDASYLSWNGVLELISQNPL